MNIQVTLATPADHPLLSRLYPLYIHDLSAFTDEFQLDDQGIWQPDYLPFWLEGHATAHALLIRAEGQPAGFAFVGQKPFPYMSPARDFCMAEFFILKRWRRHGIGRQAALALFDRFRGRWEVDELEANVPAVCFWRGLIAEYTGGDFVEMPGHGGPMQWFDNSSLRQSR